MPDIHWLEDDSTAFPEVKLALVDPNGLLAAGGDLSTRRLITAYKNAIFPWYEDGQPILWWSPNPRTILYPEKINISRSLRKVINKQIFKVTIDTAFKDVVDACSEKRREEDVGTWITNDMKKAYQNLYEVGVAHSVEVWNNGELVGGLYGVSTGKVFSGESMFSRESNASKVALAYLTEHLTKLGYILIDCQVSSSHLESLGAEEITRDKFLGLLHTHKDHDIHW